MPRKLDHWEEAEITINGHDLSFAQSMTLRVAIETFGMSLAAKSLGEDPTGKAITQGYLDRIEEMREYMRDLTRTNTQ